MDAHYKFSVAICGGGIGGLLLAVSLSRYPDIKVDVYEAAKLFADVGAGIGLWPRTWKIMEQLGLADELAKIAIISPANIPKVAFNLRKGDQPVGETFSQLVTPGGMITFHRPDFQTVVLQHLSSTSCRTHTSKRLISYSAPSDSTTSSSPVYLHFEDGTTATCDLLIGADGIKSVVRADMLRAIAAQAQSDGRVQEEKEASESIDASWSGVLMYRTSFPSEALSQKLPGHRVLHDPMIYVGRDTQLTVYPMARGTRINFAASRLYWEKENTRFNEPWIREVSRDELLSAFDGWEPEVSALLQCTPSLSRWAIHCVRSLRSYVSGPVALIGDAAHGMLPYQGVGAGQAFEDGFILANVLGHPKTTIDSLSRALEIYDVIRRPYSQRAVELSRDNALLFSLNYPGLAFSTPEEDMADNKNNQLQELHDRAYNNWDWCWTTTIDEDLQRAITMLEQS
ncbi:hypothetical protein QCA50_010525 [Cerrena zonata]|uniref:FAD-binding domain-containing protein n=1 Tax=Cerrena zonata TaxID=2478898 RepID=A0AAW0FZ79_9APHY